jgi:Putative Flp pilus-assembly TadE/G-like
MLGERAKSFFRNSCGNMGVMFAVSAIPLMVVAGSAVDFIRSRQAQTVLQAAADAAALGGGSSSKLSDSELREIVDGYVMNNGAPGAVDLITEVISKKDSATGSFSVRVRGKLDSGFMYLVGIDSMDIMGYSEVNLGSRALDLALVLDNTGSMSGTKLANLKASAKGLIQILESEKADYASLRVGVVPFSEYVNVGAGNKSASWINRPFSLFPWGGCVGSRYSPDDTDALATGRYPTVDGVNCPAELLPLTSNLVAARSKLDGLIAGGNTYLPVGIHWGWNILSEETPYAEGMSDAEMKSLQGKKIMVLMTDGENTISPTYPRHDGSDSARSDGLTTDSCDGAKADGIQIYTVSFMVSTPTVQTLLDRCASEPSMSFNADNAADLNAAFTQIGHQLADLRIVR